MDSLRSALKGQYHAGLRMLRQCIMRCPEEVWTAGTHPRTYWRIAYHALHYTQLYLQPSPKEMVPWKFYVPGMSDLWGEPDILESLSPQEVRKYLKWLDNRVDGWVDTMDLDDPKSGFSWYPIPKLEHQLVNIRHLQGHVGQLSEILMANGVSVEWISTATSKKDKSPGS